MSYTSVELDAMSGGEIVAVDVISLVSFQRVKISWGLEGVAVDASETDPFPTNLHEVGGTAVTLGQKTMAASIPVVLASDQSVTLEVNLDETNDSVTVYGSDDGGTTKRVIKTAADGAVAVDVESSALPSGASTAANQSTIIGHLDGVEGLLTTIDADTGGILLAVDGIEGLLTTIDADTGSILTSVDGIEALLTTIDTDTGNIDTSLNNIETAIQIMDDWDNAASDGASVSGDVAHDTADAGEPVKMGAKAIAHGADPTAVAANDRTNLHANRDGILFTIGGHPNILTASINVTDADGAQTDTALITVSAGTIIVVTEIDVNTDNANTGDVAVRIGFGTANTPANDAAGLLVNAQGLDGGTGIVKGNGSGILGIGADGSDLRLTCEDPAGGSVDVVVTYFLIES